jgi:hypothetical protein
VGLTKENTIFILAGAWRNVPDACATLKPEEFKKHKVHCYYNMPDFIEPGI